MMDKKIRSGYLKVTDGHKIYWEEWGNSKGIPVVYLHGGPGGQISNSSTRFFDLKKYHLFLFDQRGCGKSKPKFCLKNNNTQNLVNDIEALRNFFKIKKWLVFGGSWGSALGLFYSIQNPDKILGLILRGIFLARPIDWDWLIKPQYVGQMFPEDYKKFLEIVPKQNQDKIKEWYYKTLQSKNKKIAIEAGKRWSSWELSLLFFKKCLKTIPSNPIEDYQTALMECHYAINDSFQENKNYILDNCHLIKNLPTWLIHGQYDYICPPSNAYKLKEKLKSAKLVIAKNSGHSSSEKLILSELKKATKEFSERYWKFELN